MTARMNKQNRRATPKNNTFSVKTCESITKSTGKRTKKKNCKSIKNVDNLNDRTSVSKQNKLNNEENMIGGEISVVNGGLSVEKRLPCLVMKDKFDWNVNMENLGQNFISVEESEEDDVDSFNQPRKKLSRSEKLAAAKEAECRLRKIEVELLQSELNPQSADQFDRLLLAHPENATLWIRYISFYLQATEIDKARGIARRALQTISHHNEGERLNVWIALLNLEHTYGSEESLKEVFDEALKFNDEYTIYSKMLEIYASGNKTYNTEMVAKTMIKKFHCSFDCWSHICKVLMMNRMCDKARSFFLKAAQNLTRKEYVNLTSQFAKLENENGFIEEAHTLYENILTSFPDRIDIWNVFIDMLIKENRVEQAREVLERAVRQKLPVKKMKSLYTKWLSLEEKFGNNDSVDHVRQAAVQYINRVTNSVSV